MLTYASETWALTKRDRKQLNVFERKVYRSILGQVYDNEKENWRILTNKEIYASVKKPTIIETIRLNRLHWFGHVQRIEENRIPKRAIWEQQDLEVNQEKTKYMIVERKNSLKKNKIVHLKIKNYKFQRMENFKYLGVIINEGNSNQMDLQGRINSANKTYVMLQEFLKNKTISKKLKLRLKNTITDRMLCFAL